MRAHFSSLHNVFTEKRASPNEKQVLVASFYQTLHFYEAIACKGRRSIHSPSTTKKQSKRKEETDISLVKHREKMVSHATVRDFLSYEVRLMDLHGSSIFSSKEDRCVILAHLGLRVVGPELLGASRVTFGIAPQVLECSTGSTPWNWLLLLMKKMDALQV
jgi:hypothetical protein